MSYVFRTMKDGTRTGTVGDTATTLWDCASKHGNATDFIRFSFDGAHPKKIRRDFRSDFRFGR